MQQTFSNPDVQKNRKEYDIASIKYWHFDDALGSITQLQTELKEKYGRSSTSVTKLKTFLETNRRHASQAMKKLNKEYDDLQSKCEHDFKFDEESYTGNFDYYVCTKCGQVDIRKA